MSSCNRIIEFLSTSVSAWVSLGMYYHLTEVVLLFIGTYFFLQRSFRISSKRKLVQKDRLQEDTDRILSWIPEPLSSAPRQNAQDQLSINQSQYSYTFNSKATPKCTVNEINNVINLACFNSANLLGHPSIEAACQSTLKRLGVGSCGPRGFYGTTTEHLRCEAEFATWSGAQEAISYPFGASVPSSVIPAFCTRDDIVICDESVQESAQSGIHLSRATVHWIKHNDYESLERVMQSVTERDTNLNKIEQRRFVYLEAINGNYGTLLDLPRVIELKNKYRFRLILDESFSMGVLGEHGHGILEFYGIPRTQIEITVVDTGIALSTVGGFCCGDPVVVRHQRLSGSAYIFSASQPPFLATACIEAMKILDSQEGKSIMKKLQENIKVFREFLGNAEFYTDCGFQLDGDLESATLFIRKIPEENSDMQKWMKILYEVQYQLLMKHRVFVSIPRYSGFEHKIPSAALRISVSAGHETKDLEYAAHCIREVLPILVNEFMNN